MPSYIAVRANSWQQYNLKVPLVRVVLKRGLGLLDWEEGLVDSCSKFPIPRRNDDEKFREVARHQDAPARASATEAAEGIHFNRVAGSYRDHCHFSGDVVAGPGEGKEAGTPDEVRQ